jgi:hypothetical protein
MILELKDRLVPRLFVLVITRLEKENRREFRLSRERYHYQLVQIVGYFQGPDII